MSTFIAVMLFGCFTVLIGGELWLVGLICLVASAWFAALVVDDVVKELKK